MYLMMNIANGALIYFTLQSLIEWLVYGAVIFLIYKEKEFAAKEKFEIVQSKRVASPPEEDKIFSNAH